MISINLFKELVMLSYSTVDGVRALKSLFPFPLPEQQLVAALFSPQPRRKLAGDVFQVSQLLLAHLSLRNCSVHSRSVCARLP